VTTAIIGIILMLLGGCTMLGSYMIASDMLKQARGSLRMARMASTDSTAYDEANEPQQAAHGDSGNAEHIRVIRETLAAYELKSKHRAGSEAMTALCKAVRARLEMIK